MRQKHETAASFNQLKEITQIMQVQKTSVQTNANADASENANISDLTQKKGLKPKTSTQTKKGA
ncbi:hypothetical protein ACLGCN_05140, partial [Helicobacter pylori]